MSWRVVVVSSNAKIDFKMDYLVIRTIDDTKRVHISEIAVLMLESTAISLTAYAMCELMQKHFSPKRSYSNYTIWRSTKNGTCC